jgi:putative ABC transport system permease protein
LRRTFLPGAHPIGKTFRTFAEPHYPEAGYQIVGLVKNTRYMSLRDAEPPMAYGTMSQFPPGVVRGHDSFVPRFPEQPWRRTCGGTLAAPLATIGLYGVLACHAVRRRNEIGIRMALGATRGQIVELVLKEAAGPVAIGIAVGVACSVALAQGVASLLFGISDWDP